MVEGFSMELDAEGFEYPTSIAFVPDPGTTPDAPLYYVTEMEGSIKVVTNDRSVHTFAEGFFERVLEEDYVLPDKRAEFGLGAVALDPLHGYVFASFGYTDDEGVPRNDVIRFSTEPETFGLKPSGSLRFTEIFKDHRSSQSHQIGHMIVDGDSLWVAVGDGLDARRGQDLSSVNGKILRMTLDGQPWPENPFLSGERKERSARDYIWAFGLRNPFGLLRTPDGVFATSTGRAA